MHVHMILFKDAQQLPTLNESFTQRNKGESRESTQPKVCVCVLLGVGGKAFERQARFQRVAMACVFRYVALFTFCGSSVFVCAVVLCFSLLYRYDYECLSHDCVFRGGYGFPDMI